MERQTLLAILAIAAVPLLLIAAAAAILAPRAAPNRGWMQSLKPGAVITLEELKRLEARGWRLVRAESLYLYQGASRLYGHCNTTLLLAETLRPSSWGETGAADFRPLKPLAAAARLSNVANASIYYRPARLYWAPTAYCLEPLNWTAYRVTGVIRHAYIGEGRGEPYKIIIRVDHERFEKLLREEWLERLVKIWGVPREEALRLLRLVRIERWVRVVKSPCGVRVVLDVPLFPYRPQDYDSVLARAYPNTYLRLVILPVAKMIHCLIAREWLTYNDDYDRDAYPPDWLVRGAVCWQKAEWNVRLLRMLGKPAYILSVGRVHEATVVCNNASVTPGYCYGLLAESFDGRRKVICWLIDDTGYAMGSWSELIRVGVIYAGRQAQPQETYRVVKTWIGCEAPRGLLNATRAG